MLTIKIPATEFYDEKREVFIRVPERTLSLEHSLVSISKWEAKWHKPFLSDEKKTNEEMLDYVRCMTITQNVDPTVYYALPYNALDEINKYIEDPQSATVFYDKPQRPHRKERITSEKIFFWMVRANIPFECKTWHLNRLLNLIHYCNSDSQPHKKRSAKEIAKDYAAINAARRKQFNTTG